MPRRTAASRLAVAVVLSLQAACASVPPPLEPLSEAARSRLGVLGVAWARYDPAVAVERPPKGVASGFTRGAAEGARAGTATGDDGPDHSGPDDEVEDDLGEFLQGLLRELLLAPLTAAAGALVGAGLGALVGGAAGAVSAPRGSIAERVREPVANAVPGLYVQDELYDRVVETARRATRYRVVAVSGVGPSSRDEAVDYRSVEGVDAVLEVGIVRITVETGEGEGRPVPLVLAARARLVRTSDGTVLRAGTVGCRTPARRVVEWTAVDGDALHEAFGACYGRLAARIVDDLFVRPPGDAHTPFPVRDSAR